MAQVPPLSEFYKTVNPENAYVREQLRVYRALGQRSTDAVGWIALKLRLSRAKAEALITRATPPPPAAHHVADRGPDSHPLLRRACSPCIPLLVL